MTRLTGFEVVVLGAAVDWLKSIHCENAPTDITAVLCNVKHEIQDSEHLVS